MTPKLQIGSNKLIDQNSSISDILTILLKNRQLTKKTYHDYITPKYPAPQNLIHQLKLKHISRCQRRINQAIKNQENILIYGDYDVDGVTSTAILFQTLIRLGGQVHAFLPHREQDGYGFKSESFFKFQKLLNLKFTLLITVDNGIVATGEFAKVVAKQKIDIIVTDHHLPDSSFQLLVSSVYSIVHSPLVSGATLSWLLSYVLDKNADLGLAALGAVADCMPLIGVNRQIVVHGLQSLRLSPCPGIKKLVEISHAKIDSLSAYDLGFVLGPRINAVGRLSSPDDAFNLLVADSIEKASKYASILNNYNSDRQILQKENIDQASQEIDPKNKLIFISSKNYHPGVIGLIASRLTQDYYLPSVVISIDGDIAKGSCRSIKEVNIIEALRQFSGLFIDVGGHQGAAGFTLLSKNIPKLKTKLTRYFNQQLKNQTLLPTIDIDAKMALSAVTLRNIKLIQKLEPFGIGNPQPLFLFEKITITSKRVVGSTADHLSLKFGNISAIAFKKGHLDQDLKVGDLVDVVASLDLNHWQGHQIPQLIVKEIMQ